MVELFTRSYLFLLQDIHIMDGSDEEDQMLKVDFIWYPKFFNLISYSLDQNFGYFLFNFDWLQTFQPIGLILQMG